MKFFIPGGGGPGRQNFILFKVVFKIHFRPFWVILVKNFRWKKGGPILSHFWPIFGFWKFLQLFDISGGQKTLFFKKCPNNGLVSEKKYIETFSILGGGGVRPKCGKFHTFFFEGFPKALSHVLWPFWTLDQSRILYRAPMNKSKNP